MTSLIATKSNAKFISEVIQQGAGESDWLRYQASVQSKLSPISVNPASTENVLVADLSEAPYPFPSDGDTIYIRETGSNDVKTHVASDLTDTLVEGWDITAASLATTTSLSAQSGIVKGIFFKPDGTKMYAVGLGGDRKIYEYNLTSPWRPSTKVYVRSFDVSAQTTDPSGLFFKPDGTKMYICNRVANYTLTKEVYEYSLSSGWDTSTLTYVRNFDISAQIGYAYNIFFKPDGTRMYVSGATIDNEAKIFEYSLSSEWNTGTLSYVRSFDLSSSNGLSGGIFFRPDGTRMYGARSNGYIYEYTLGVGWDIDTLVYRRMSRPAGIDDVDTITFKPDGTRMYIVDLNKIEEYLLPEGSLILDISSLNLSLAPSNAMLAHNVSLSISSEFNADRCLTEDYQLANFSATNAQCSGDLRSGMGQTVFDGDRIILEVDGVQKEVTVLSSSLNAPTLTLTYNTQSSAPTSCTIPSRAIANTVDYMQYLSDGNLRTTYKTQIINASRAMQYRLDAEIFTQINQLNVDLWKDI